MLRTTFTLVVTKCLELQPASGQAIGQVAFAEMALGRLVPAEAHLNAALVNSIRLDEHGATF